jgi:uncharacterized protein
MTLPRRDLIGHAGLLVGLTLGLGGCANGPPAPPPRYYRLPLQPPVSAAQPAQPAGVAPAGVSAPWQIVGGVKLPELLDREPLWLPVGNSGLQALEGHRWAEPLRDALPRVLRQDLETLRGPGTVWVGTPPPGGPAPRQLRVELLALEVTPDRRGVFIAARWSLTQADAAALVDEVRLTSPATAPEADALVVAHRLALWRLAEHIVRSGTGAL